MLSKLKEHPNLGYFLAYSVSYLAYGTLITGLGPLIPYLSAKSGIIETQYSYLFSCRSIGMFVGALLLKYLQQLNTPPTNHQIITVCSISMCIFSILFTYSSSTFLSGLWMFIGSMFYSSFEIAINICVLMINPAHQIQFWLLLTHGVFGIGGLIGPFLVLIFQQNTFAVLGIFVAAVVPAFCWLVTPEKNGFSSGGEQETVKGKEVQWRIQYILCFTMFMYIGLQCTYGGWISSYAVLAQVADKSQATVFPTVFWIFITIFRFVLAFVEGSSSMKMRRLIQGIIFTACLSLCMIWFGLIKQACYMSALLFGVSMSSLYPLVISVCSQFGASLKQHQTSNIIGCGVIAQGILTMFVGMIMEWTHINMLFVSIAVMGGIMWMSRYYFISLFEEGAKEEAIELLQIKQ